MGEPVPQLQRLAEATAADAIAFTGTLAVQLEGIALEDWERIVIGDLFRENP